jgi:voltage-gated potassium channel
MCFYVCSGETLMNKKALLNPRFFGLMGVTKDESDRAKFAARTFEAPMILLATWIIIDGYLQNQSSSYEYGVMSDWLIWGFFVVETTTLSILTNKPKAYLSSNWVNLLIILFSFPLLWELFPYAAGFRILRLVVLFTLIIQASKTLQKVLGRNNLGSILISSFILIVIAGTIMSVIDPNVHSPADGIWWAWVTVTTVGYGDIVPASNAGRLFGAFLILLGIGLFTMLTASFAAFFMAEDEKGMIKLEHQNIRNLTNLEARFSLLESKIDTLLDNQLEIQKSIEDTASKKP